MTRAMVIVESLDFSALFVDSEIECVILFVDDSLTLGDFVSLEV